MIPDGDISHMLRVINDLPLFNVNIRARVKDNDPSNEWKSQNGSNPFAVSANRKVEIEISLYRSHGNTGKIKVHSPKYHKTKTPSWWIVLGDGTKNELSSMKRIGEVTGKSHVSILEFTADDIPTGSKKMTIHVVCDSLFGMNATTSFHYETATNRKLLRKRLKEEADLKFAEEQEKRQT